MPSRFWQMFIGDGAKLVRDAFALAKVLGHIRITSCGAEDRILR